MESKWWEDKNRLREQNAPFLPIIGVVVAVVCVAIILVLHHFQHGGW